ncbi:MAG: hypothetical protein ABI867_33525 [Kofleriaceae bacterium]
MSSRIGSAALALTAAALLVLSILPVGELGWWSGHPTINDQAPISRKEVHVNLIGAARGCNIGGDDDKPCDKLPLQQTFIIVKYAEAGAIGLLILSLILVGTLAVNGSRRRHGFARMAIVVTLVALVGAIVAIVIGPGFKLEMQIAVPFGIGLYLFFGGTALSIAGGLWALSPDKPAKQPAWATLSPPAATRPSQPIPPPQQPQPQPEPEFDVLALLQDDVVRPTVQPMGRAGGVPSPGGMLPGPSGPLGPPPGASQPLFQSAPQLRPLYEQNGSPGYVPMPAPPPMPHRGPTPLPVDAVNAFLGNATPAHPAAAIPQPPPPPPPSKTLPPPIRNKPPSIAPPLPRSTTQRPPSPKPAPTIASAAVPPPPGMAIPSTIAGFAAAPIVTPGATLAGPVGFHMLPIRAETDPSELDQTVDFDKSGERRTNSQSENTNTNTESIPFETVTGESAGFSIDPPTETELGADSLDDHIETAARAKVSVTMEAVALPDPRVSASLLTSAVPPRKTPQPAKAVTPIPTVPMPAPGTVVPLPPVPAPGSRPPPATPPPAKVTGSVPKVPISTAPESLPPPEDKQVATSGPSPACPQCESPMAWVENHLRFYCKSCRMYF